MSERTYFQRCSACKTEIGFGDVYWACSVSTCNRKRTGMFFCTVGCWEMHLPMMRHREAYAVEKRAPSQGQWQKEQEAEAEAEAARAERAERAENQAAAEPDATRRRKVASPDGLGGGGVVELSDQVPRDVLIVASKLKKYVTARSGLRTSDTVLKALSDIVRAHCDDAIRRAVADERKTVMDRDFKKPS